jgi:anthranilate/para-aminobenzoate synthase component II
MKRLLFIDFEDSFTFNLIQEFENLGVAVDLVHWKDLGESYPHQLLVLGPGPGHPSDYEAMFPFVNSWLHHGKKLFGVCLGHQILWHLRGALVTRSKLPLHGQRVELKLNRDWKEWLGLEESVFVQRYNSLAVFHPTSDFCNFIQEDEVLMSRGPNVVSYQFHPESLGTTCRRAFLRPVLRDLL